MALREVNRAIGETEGLYLSELAPGDVVLIGTTNGKYSMIYLGASAAAIARHNGMETQSRTVNILGSTGDGASLSMGFLGVGLSMEFERTEDARVVMTSPIEWLRRPFDGEACGVS